MKMQQKYLAKEIPLIAHISLSSIPLEKKDIFKIKLIAKKKICYKLMVEKIYYTLFINKIIIHIKEYSAFLRIWIYSQSAS